MLHNFLPLGKGLGNLLLGLTASLFADKLGRDHTGLREGVIFPNRTLHARGPGLGVVQAALVPCRQAGSPYRQGHVPMYFLDLYHHSILW